MNALHGIFPALTTPFVHGWVATDRWRDALERYERVGFAGYLVLGSTGEAPYLDDAERGLAIQTLRRCLPEGRTILAGVNAEATVAAVHQAEEAARLGADVALVSSPHYFAAGMSATALEIHFRTVAEASPIPILLYNVPKFTGLSIPPEVVETLAGHTNVAGMKDSSGTPGYLLDVLARVPRDFQVLCGDAALLPFALESGAVGGILAAATAIPEPFVETFRHVRAGDLEKALAVHRAAMVGLRAGIGTHGVAGFKAAMDVRALPGGDPRPPLLPVSDATRARIVQAIDALVEGGVLPDRDLGLPEA
jgi:4-hydroxy-2-oxoglutarate aldolase